MIIGVVRESQAGETRVAATPGTVRQLAGLGYEVVVESGAGQAASLSDGDYTDAGAAVAGKADAWGADIVLAVNAPSDDEIDLLHPAAMLVAMLSPGLRPDLVRKLAQRTVTALAVDAVPRISRAQSLDVLSSMANIAGYRAVWRPRMPSGGSSPAR
jgi:NAD(P) transhydrogenase subunit alpha